MRQAAASGATTNWTETNAYDRYGNRWLDLGGGSQNLKFSKSSNRITTSGFSCDSAGNLTNAGVHSYVFDAENRIVKIDSVTAYSYDGVLCSGGPAFRFLLENHVF